MNYADVSDWLPYQILQVESAQAAIAIEAMAHARLANQDLRIARFKWTRLPDQKTCWADECFRCSPSHAASVVSDMAKLYRDNIA